MMKIPKKLRQLHFRINKRLGQNFLREEEILHEILSRASVQPDDVVLEIGAGSGILTDPLTRSAGKVIALEIDPALYAYLAERFKDRKNLNLLHQNILKYDMGDLPETGVKVIANLPYYISTPILMHLLRSIRRFSLILVMLQKEVAERIAAGPGTKKYGSLSIAVQYYMAAEIVYAVPRTAFYPVPEVDSALLRLTRHKEPPVAVSDPERFFCFVRAAFARRRKTLRNSLLGAGSFSPEQLDTAFAASGIDPRRRAETLSIKEFAKLSRCLH
ncbi:MAG: 16S rRNA (adenine(1518)-N(6)/adenine(1519)-N(6))-dimethyltransferase RsmA [Deltaproteobacteria bacterium]|nr:16S rRNA (adenine(1518)-N(6)/adenine(1519)-N(6))-dimethyltransferase RsmA [Deltaproteobacteria bacterium]